MTAVRLIFSCSTCQSRNFCAAWLRFTCSAEPARLKSRSTRVQRSTPSAVSYSAKPKRLTTPVLGSVDRFQLRRARSRERQRHESRLGQADCAHAPAQRAARLQHEPHGVVVKQRRDLAHIHRRVGSRQSRRRLRQGTQPLGRRARKRRALVARWHAVLRRRHGVAGRTGARVAWGARVVSGSEAPKRPTVRARRGVAARQLSRVSYRACTGSQAGRTLRAAQLPVVSARHHVLVLDGGTLSAAQHALTASMHVLHEGVTLVENVPAGCTKLQATPPSVPSSAA